MLFYFQYKKNMKLMSNLSNNDNNKINNLFNIVHENNIKNERKGLLMYKYFCRFLKIFEN